VAGGNVSELTTHRFGKDHERTSIF
jgi:hypothetical protein